MTELDVTYKLPEPESKPESSHGSTTACSKKKQIKKQVFTNLKYIIGVERRAGGRAVHGRHADHARQRQPVRARALRAAPRPRQLAAGKYSIFILNDTKQICDRNRVPHKFRDWAESK